MNIRINRKSGTRKNLAAHFYFLVAISAIGLAQNVRAVGFLLPNQDPEAIARGDAFAATADNASAIYYNPAGITQIPGQSVRVGLYAISPDDQYTSPSGQNARVDSNFQYVPQFYYTCSFTNVPISVGFGTYVPYGLALDWGNKAPFNTVAQSGKLLYVSFNPVIAWRPIPSLSVAIGPTINYSSAKFARSIGNLPGDLFRFDGNATGYGFNAGILWQPHPMWSFGINYRSPTSLNYNGTIETLPTPPYPASASSSVKIDFPQYVTGGISFRPTTNWNFEFDLEYAQWSVIKQFTFQDPALGNPALALNFRDSYIYDFGITRQLGDGYFVSVGYIYAQNSSPDANFNPLIPDADLQLGSVGVGHHGRRWDWALAYQFAYNGGRTVSNDSNALADGNYTTYNKAINLAVGFKF